MKRSLKIFAAAAAAAAGIAWVSLATAQKTLFPTISSVTGNEYIQLAYPSTYGPLYVKTSQLKTAATTVATSSTVGTVKPDNTTTSVDANGAITAGSVAGHPFPYQLPVNLASPATHTGDTNEAILGWVNVPASAVGADGCVNLDTIWKVTGNNNTWQIVLRVITGTVNGTTSGTGMQSNAVNAGRNNRISDLLCNYHSVSAQVMYASSDSFTASTVPIGSASINTASAWTISINTKLQSASDLIELLHAHAIAVPGT